MTVLSLIKRLVKGVALTASDFDGNMTAIETAVNGKPDTTVTVATTASITGGGDLSASRTHSLVNDSASPGALKVYGTDSGGTKGWQSAAAGSAAVVQDQGVSQGSATTLNFAGAGVTAGVSGGVATVNIPGGSASVGQAVLAADFLDVHATTSGDAVSARAVASARRDSFSPTTQLYEPTITRDTGWVVASGETPYLVPRNATSSSYDMFVQYTDFGLWQTSTSVTTGLLPLPTRTAPYTVEKAALYPSGMSTAAKNLVTERLAPPKWATTEGEDVSVTVAGVTFRTQNAAQPWNVRHATNKATDYWRFEIRQGEQWEFGGYRSEISCLTTLSYGTTRWWAFSCMIEPGLVNTSQWFLFHQIHNSQDSNDAGQSPPFALELGSAASGTTPDVVRINLHGDPNLQTTVSPPDNYVYTGTTPFARGVWHDVVCKALFTKGTPDAQLTVWIDGVQLYNATGLVMGYNDVVGWYAKFGLYRADTTERAASRYANFALPTTTSLLSRVTAPPVVC